MFNFTNEELEKMANELVNILKEEERELKEFYVNEQHELMKKVYNYLKLNNGIHNENLSCFPENYPFTSDEFYLLTTNLRNSINKEDWLTDEENIFSSKSILFTYDGTLIELLYTYRQGTAVSLMLANEEDFKDYLDNISKYEDLTPEWS